MPDNVQPNNTVQPQGDPAKPNVETKAGEGKQPETKPAKEDIGKELNTKVQVDTPTFSLDEFMTADFSGDDTFTKEHTNLPDYKTILNRHVTPEGKKVLANIRADYTRKTQELAATKKQLEDERKAVQAEREALYSGDYAKKIKEAAAQDTKAIDPYTPEGLAKLIEIETAKRLQEQLKPMQEKLIVERQRLEAEAFIAAHPDIKTDAFKAKLGQLFKARPDISVEDAYHIVKGQLSDELKTKELEDKKKSKEETKAFIKNTPNGKVINPAQLPKGKSAAEIYRLLQQAKN